MDHTSQLCHLVVHIGRRIDTTLRELWDLGSEALLDGLEHGLVIGAADERDT